MIRLPTPFFPFFPFFDPVFLSAGGEVASGRPTHGRHNQLPPHFRPTPFPTHFRHFHDPISTHFHPHNRLPTPCPHRPRVPTTPFPHDSVSPRLPTPFPTRPRFPDNPVSQTALSPIPTPIPTGSSFVARFHACLLRSSVWFPGFPFQRRCARPAPSRQNAEHHQYNRTNQYEHIQPRRCPWSQCAKKNYSNCQTCENCF